MNLEIKKVSQNISQINSGDSSSVVQYIKKNRNDSNKMYHLIEARLGKAGRKGVYDFDLDDADDVAMLQFLLNLNIDGKSNKALEYKLNNLNIIPSKKNSIKLIDILNLMNKRFKKLPLKAYVHVFLNSRGLDYGQDFKLVLNNKNSNEELVKIVKEFSGAPFDQSNYNSLL